MQAKELAELLGVDFYTGVPDSLLKPFINYLMSSYGVDGRHHVIGANEGNCAALAAGYYLATGKVPAVYLQNSGEGNIVNPVLSLLSEKVYGIPVLFLIGWRGELDVHDEPQHIHQGAATLSLLDAMNMDYFVVGKETTISDLQPVMERFRERLSQGQQTAFVIRKGALSYEEKVAYQNEFALVREEAIGKIVGVAGEDIIVATTGKAGRELYEIREKNGEGHAHDFLVVGSMGHASSIALGIAMNKPNRRVWCVDGDGAALMHMGALATIGKVKPLNLVHVLINNAAHESVGGMPTAQPDFCRIAEACGYEYVASADTMEKLELMLKTATEQQCLSFLEIRCRIGSRPDLGRPAIPPRDNKANFMRQMRGR